VVAGTSINETRSLGVFAGGVKLMVGLSPSMSPMRFHVGAGPDLRRGLANLDQSTSKTNGWSLWGRVQVPINQTGSGWTWKTTSTTLQSKARGRPKMILSLRPA
jgi:hypothetical protein